MSEPEGPGLHHVATAARQFLLRARGPGGLGAKQCDALAALLETAETEARVLAKASEALGAAAERAKETLLRCRAPDTDPGAYDERQRVIGLLEDLVRGLADTNGLRVLWLSQAAAEALKLPPPGGKPCVLKWRPERGAEAERERIRADLLTEAALIERQPGTSHAHRIENQAAATALRDFANRLRASPCPPS